MTAPTLETRLFDAVRFAEVGASKSGTKFKYLEGRAVPFDTWTDVGWYLEKMAPSVFRKSIRESARALPLQLWHNDRTWAVGKASKWTESPEGLDAVWELDGSAEAQRAAQMANDGFLTGLSVGFQTLDGGSDWELADPEDPTSRNRVTRTQARLHEVSLVNAPQYAQAAVTLVRSKGKTGLHAKPNLAQWRQWRDSIGKD